MTNNEKAATFIGWRAHCPEHQGEMRCSKAPDMSLPQNYMRALEDLDYIIQHLSHWRPSLIEVYIDPEGAFGFEPQGGCHAHGIGLTVGAAAIAALATLYDAERVRDATAGV